ncbi:hypothetical protein PENTCL1PPCAC_24289, partial [Pristionchus entomophagus]
KSAVKADTTHGGESISLRIVTQGLTPGTNYEVSYYGRKKFPLGKLKQSFADKLGFPLRSMIFMVNGTRIWNDDTPESLKIDENDNIIHVTDAQITGLQLKESLAEAASGAMLAARESARRPEKVPVVSLADDDDVEVIEVSPAEITESPESPAAYVEEEMPAAPTIISNAVSTEEEDEVICMTPSVQANDCAEDQMECDDATDEQSVTVPTPSESTHATGTSSISIPVEGNAMEESVESPATIPVDDVETASAEEQMECEETEKALPLTAETPSDSTPVDDDVIVDEQATTSVVEEDGYETAIEIERPVKYLK